MKGKYGLGSPGRGWELASLMRNGRRKSKSEENKGCWGVLLAWVQGGTTDTSDREVATPSLGGGE